MSYHPLNHRAAASPETRADVEPPNVTVLVETLVLGIVGKKLIFYNFFKLNCKIGFPNLLT